MENDLRDIVIRQAYEEYFTVQKYDNSVTKGTNHKWIKNALDEYFTRRSMELLEWMAVNNVDCDSSGQVAQLTGEQVFYYKGEWITAEELFSNFL